MVKKVIQNFVMSLMSIFQKALGFLNDKVEWFLNVLKVLDITWLQKIWPGYFLLFFSFENILNIILDKKKKSKMASFTANYPPFTPLLADGNYVNAL